MKELKELAALRMQAIIEGKIILKGDTATTGGKVLTGSGLTLEIDE
ncbi:hypothetical protein [Xenorhabdus beddingii]|nr:hypothetical protein [Xenorhabdus beddingii]